MKQKDKELLLKDLCSRLPYGVVLNVDNGKYREDMKIWPYLFDYDSLWDAKPYLRPMSSMTEEERNEYFNIIKNSIDFYNCPKSEDICFLIIPIDWLNSHHFDYRGLIEKNLALEAPKGIYNLND